MSGLPPFPQGTQPQIIRAHQKDLFYVFHLREETESVLRSWLGTRWLTRWDKEIELLAKLLYYGLTTLRGTQTLGEEYVNIRQLHVPTQRLPSEKLRAAMILLPTLPSYLISRFSRHVHLPADSYSRHALRALPNVLEALVEINLAAFYLKGTYYSLAKRLFRTRYLSLVASDPNNQPPSYSLLGILLGIRLLYRIHTLLSPFLPSSNFAPRFFSSSAGDDNADETEAKSKQTYIDSTPIPTLVPSTRTVDEDQEGWGDRTIMNIEALDSEIRSNRKCALCLEERTASSVTECGHVFCWTCIVGWGREKAECPLCRQSLHLSRILPVYNL